jgi:quercetin dioxygenase-like cupin family protein
MNPVKAADRRVVNIHTAPFKPWIGRDGDVSGQHTLQLDDAKPQGVGFHVFRMDPGSTTDAHEHTEHEEFLILSGELIENDGTVYREGDLVWMRKGTEHSSHTETGCVMAVFIAAPERLLPE